VLKQMGSVLDEVMARLNAPESPIQGIPRINEVSSHFEDLIRELLNKTPGLACDFPKTAAGGKQRSGYPDLELVDQLSHRVYYLDPKLYAVGSRDSLFRTFYFEPKIATNKVREDAVHFIVGFEHEKPSADQQWKFTRWDLVDLSHFQVKLKAEFQGSNRDMYRPGSDRRDEWEESGVMVGSRASPYRRSLRLSSRIAKTMRDPTIANYDQAALRTRTRRRGPRLRSG